jgi:autotransporter-associated beta strand protein
MKPLSPHDPRNDAFDDLIAVALHGELTPEERAQFEARLSNDPAAQAAYQEAQAMHDLLEKNYKSAQPDPAFEQRMVSGVRRKIQREAHRETAWESLVALWMGLKRFFVKRRAWEYAAVCLIFAVLAGVALGPITNGIKQADGRSHLLSGVGDLASAGQIPSDGSVVLGAVNAKAEKQRQTLNGAITFTGGTTVTGGTLAINSGATTMTATPPSGRASGSFNDANGIPATPTAPSPRAQLADSDSVSVAMNAPAAPSATFGVPLLRNAAKALTVTTQNGQTSSVEAVKVFPYPAATTEASAPDTRKLIRNAQLDLEVKSFQATMDQITALTKTAGGYVDTSNSQRGGNGKLQGTVVVKVLPQNLDAFLLKLRDLGQVKNQSVSTDDVTKAYFDTQARLDNSRRMETQLQELLKHENSKVSDLLQVERELGRVRGEIEQMQGQLKLYDFQVQYATVTMQVREKDLNQAAAYLLKEQDDFSLFATDVEGTFQKARQIADDFKAQILAANLNHNSGSDVSAELVVMVAPDQIEPFLGRVRSLGRVANFTRQTQRVAKDGGDSDQPADQTLTEKDKVQAHLVIRSDDETRKRVALTMVAKAVDDALDQAKTAALANAGVEILSSSLNKTPQGQSTAQLTVRVPGKDYSALIATFNALGRTASLSIQRNDNSGPGANGDDAPVIVSLALTDDDTPLQETEMTVLAADVDHDAQQIKKDAATAGVEVKASSFERQPDGTELARMTFRLPMSKYPAFVESVRKLGKVESLTVRREDRPDQTRVDDTAPAEISLQLHNQRDIVADNSGLFATLRQTFGEGAEALFGSVRVIGVVIAFIVPWVVTLVLLAWVGRRIYVWKKR